MKICDAYKICAVFVLIISFYQSFLYGNGRMNMPLNADVVQRIQRLRIPFVLNKGQVADGIRFYAVTPNGNISVTKDGGLVYSMPLGKDSDKGCTIQDKRCKICEAFDLNSKIQNVKYNLCSQSKIQNLKADVSHSEFRNPNSEMGDVSIKEELVGAMTCDVTGEDETITKVNYFKGNDPSKWHTSISAYDVISFGEVYDGIGLKLRAYGDNIERLFCIKPYADPDQIRMRLSDFHTLPLAEEDIVGLKVNNSGALEIETESGIVKLTKPTAYQEIDGKRVEVEVAYQIAESGMQHAEERSLKSALSNQRIDAGDPNLKFKIQNLKFDIGPHSESRNPHLEYGLKVTRYDKSKDLIISSALTSMYIGGDDTDSIFSITTGSDKSVYVAGYTKSSNLPIPENSYDASYNGGGDAFILRLNEDLTKLISATYLGGTAEDTIWSMSSDSTGNIYVAGYTWSSDFPATKGAYDKSFNAGYTDAFIAKLNNSLTELLSSTYLGGSDEDYGYSLAIGHDGTAYIAGRTLSSDFPITTNAYDAGKGHYGDVFVSRLSGDLKEILASTYLGGNYDDAARSLLIDYGGNVYVAGRTGSPDFPMMPGAFDDSYNDGDDGFISRLKGDLSGLLGSTFLGGSSDDFIWSMGLDSIGNLYLTGKTSSIDFLKTTNAYDTIYNGGDRDAFVTLVSGDLTNMLASTFLGGSANDWGYAIAIDSAGNVYVTGETSSHDYPTTSNANNMFYKGGERDAFISVLDSTLNRLFVSSFFGGDEYDYISTMTIDSDGNMYAAGYTNSPDFPVTKGAYDTTYNGNDAFVLKFMSNFITPHAKVIK